MITRGGVVRFARNYRLVEKGYGGKKGSKRNEVLPPLISVSPLVNPSHAFLFNVEESTYETENREKWKVTEKESGTWKEKKKKKKKKKISQIPSQDLKLIIRKVLCRHVPKESITMVVYLLLDYLYALLYLVFSIIYI